MVQTTYILLFFSVLPSFLPHGKAELNLTLPGQHPDPEAVATDVHRYIIPKPHFFCLFSSFLGV